MSGNLNNRVARLEEGGHGKGRKKFIFLNGDETEEAALKVRGIDPTDHDSVTFVRWITPIKRSPGGV